MPLAAVPHAPTDLAWRVIGLGNLYRLLIPPAVYALHLFLGEEGELGRSNPTLFVWTCVVYFAMGIAMGYAVHVGVRQLQDQVEAWSEDLIIDFMSAKADAMRERTRIGDIGKVKLSDRILMRVVPQGTRDLVLLREAAFDRYQSGTWQNSTQAFRPVGGDRDRWIVRPGEARRALTIKRSLPGGEGVLALPPGVHAISRLPAATMGVLPTGAVRASSSSRSTRTTRGRGA